MYPHIPNELIPLYYRLSSVDQIKMIKALEKQHKHNTGKGRRDVRDQILPRSKRKE